MPDSTKNDFPPGRSSALLDGACSSEDAIPCYVVQLSPAGSTRLVAASIREGIEAAGCLASCVDCAQPVEVERALGSMNRQTTAILFIGSPVYADRALPPVLELIDRIPEHLTLYAAPFVTWGGVCSGLALWQLGERLASRGAVLLGGMKILALHSMMWKDAAPLGHQHPDQDECALASRFAQRVVLQVLEGTTEPISPDLLNDHPVRRSERMRARLDKPWPVSEKWVLTERCIQCGDCAAACPVGVIELIPYPSFQEGCINCYNCIRACPHDALQSKLDQERLIRHLKARAAAIAEQPVSTVYGLEPD